jgi:rod shape-determining protein MreB
VKGKGIVLSEPSVVAISRRDNRIEAIGSQAREMVGRNPHAIEVIRPLREGVIADYLVTEAMLRYLIRRVMGGMRYLGTRPEVMVCVPIGATSVEQRAVRDAAEQAGARKPAWLIPEPLAAALGARLPISAPRGSMVVDIGGGRTEAAVISLSGIVVADSVRIGGDKLDEAIAHYVRRRHNLIIGERTAEEVKIAIGSALPLEEELTMEAQGRDQVTGLPRTVTLTSTEIAQAIQDPLSAIIERVRGVLERTPPELASDIVERGIILTGGGALLRKIDQLLTEELGVPCMVAENPLQCVALGAAMALERLETLKRYLPTEQESLVPGA